MNWYIHAFKNFTNFSGRTHRPAYWYFILFTILVNFGCAIIDNVMGTFNPDYGLGAVGGFYMLVAFIPSIAVAVRRLHDTNRSGWWLLLGLIPVIGALVILVFLIFRSDSGANQYGPRP